MRDLVKYLLPFCLRYKKTYITGIGVVLLANFFYVQSTVWIGKTVDYLTAPGMSFVGSTRFLIVILAFVAAGAVAHYFQRILIIGASRHIEYEFRNDFFKHLSRLSPSFYDRMRTGDIISRATSDVDQIRQALGPGILYPMDVLTVAPLALFAMVSSSWSVTLVCLVPVVIMPLLVNVISSAMYRRSLSVQEHFSDFSARIQESIAGIRVAKSFVRSDRELATLEKMNQRNAKLNVALALVHAFFHPCLMFLFVLGTILIILVGSVFVTADTELLSTKSRMLTKGELITFVLLYRRLFFPLLRLGWVMGVCQRAAASMHRVRLLWSQKPAIRDNDVTDHALTKVAGAIEFRHLTFSFDGSERPALNDVSFSAPAGRTIGIVGCVGCGKSTVAQLVARLYEPPQGQVFIDGRDIREYPLDSLRRSVGVVFQETYLFSETIKGNICFGMTGQPDEAAARAAAEKAAVAEEIETFPGAYDAMVGERGVNLSGGQKQRIALARALVYDPPILILDDAFASVDTQTEQRILGDLRDVMAERTTILISHRISTVRLADEILVLDEGGVAEQGSHGALVARDGLYARIHRRQLLEKAIEEGGNGE